MSAPFVIDPATGRVRFPELNLELRALMPEKEFIAATAAFNRDDLGSNDGWRRYSIGYASGDRKWGLFFVLINGLLNRVSFAYAPIDATWDNWTEKIEQQRVQEYENELSKQLGGGRVFSWGEVAILLDSKSGGNNIWINYSADQKGDD